PNLQTQATTASWRFRNSRS
ncbi:DUF4219 domain-containing protein, partial [Cephalotus follicularis]